MGTDEKLPPAGQSLRFRRIIGRERALMEALARGFYGLTGGPPTKRALAQVRRHNAGDKMWETNRGYAFEVQIIGPEGDVTGHIARVTVELDRFDAGKAAR